MPRPGHVSRDRPIDIELLHPVIDEHGSGLGEIGAAIQALVTWGSSTGFRQRVMRDADFPLTDDLPAFLLLNQLIYRGAARPTDLADAVGTGRSNISKIVRRLEDAGLILRGPDPRDDRAVVVVLTPAGREVASRVIDAQGSSRIDPANMMTTEEFADLSRLLVKFVKMVDASPEHPLTTFAGVSFGDS